MFRIVLFQIYAIFPTNYLLFLSTFCSEYEIIIWCMSCCGERKTHTIDQSIRDGFFGMKKKKLILICIGVVALLAIIGVVIFLFFTDKGYRLLKVFEYSGRSSIIRGDLGEMEPYENMVLESGDVVSLDTGNLVLKADEDKYIYLEEHTKLKLLAEGTSEKSKTTIELMEGAITNDIQSKLSEGSSYDVTSPNATMSVRGTMFRVEVYEENGVKYTRVSVFQGAVETHLIYKDGSISDTAVTIEKGKEVLIYEDDKTTDYVSPPTDIDYTTLPEKILNLIKQAIEDGRDVSLTKEQVEEYLQSTVVVTFTYQGQVFGTQTVKKGEKIQEPTLVPSPTGSWSYDFSQPVNEDITIEWK